MSSSGPGHHPNNNNNKTTLMGCDTIEINQVLLLLSVLFHFCSYVFPMTDYDWKNKRLMECSYTWSANSQRS